MDSQFELPEWAKELGYKIPPNTPKKSPAVATSKKVSAASGKASPCLGAPVEGVYKVRALDKVGRKYRLYRLIHDRITRDLCIAGAAGFIALFSIGVAIHSHLCVSIAVGCAAVAMFSTLLAMGMAEKVVMLEKEATRAASPKY